MHFGIDLGTTNSLIAVFRGGAPELIPNALGQFLTPSVVALHQGRLVIGEAARAISLSHPAQSAALFKRAMGTDRAYRLGQTDYNAPELSAMILSALKADAEAYCGTTLSDVVISVPAYFNELQRKAVRAAGRIAGLNVTQSGLDANDTTFRPALIKLAEQAKVGLSSDAQIHLQAELGGKPIDLHLTRDRFDDITAPLLTRLAAPLDRALHDSGFSVQQIDKVVLVGGATRMAAVRAYAGRKLRQFPVIGLDPDQVMALGAAAQHGTPRIRHRPLYL